MEWLEPPCAQDACPTGIAELSHLREACSFQGGMAWGERGLSPMQPMQRRGWKHTIGSPPRATHDLPHTSCFDFAHHPLGLKCVFVAD